jgi:hypothetical protein
MLGKELSFLNQFEPQFTHRRQGLHMGAANLTGDVASPVHLALVDYIQQSVGKAAPFL